MFFIGLSLDDVGIILADVKDNESLKEMASKSTVVINCVGPVGLFCFIQFSFGFEFSRLYYYFLFSC